jgi:Uncharacterized protein conserved in bacteria
MDVVGYALANNLKLVAKPWTTKAPMPTHREQLGIGVVNGKLYAVGGFDGSYFFAKNEEYNPSTNTWETKAPMPTPREALGVGVIDNKLYAVGGYKSSPLATNEEYDPSTNTWETKAPMPTPREL